MIPWTIAAAALQTKAQRTVQPESLRKEYARRTPKMTSSKNPATAIGPASISVINQSLSGWIAVDSVRLASA